MKKSLVVAAIVAASVLPTMPAGAADMKTMAKAAEAVPAYCYFLPLLPKCIDAWKAEMAAMKQQVSIAEAGAPASHAKDDDAPASAGAFFVFDHAL